MYGSALLNVVVEANITEALKEAGRQGLHIRDLGPKVGMDPAKLGMPISVHTKHKISSVNRNQGGCFGIFVPCTTFIKRYRQMCLPTIGYRWHWTPESHLRRSKIGEFPYPSHPASCRIMARVSGPLRYSGSKGAAAAVGHT
jgi:hypothetical protein